MAEGVRKRGKTWSYYFDTAKIGGERNKIEKGGFRTQREAVEARAKAIAAYKETGRIFKPSEMSVSDYLDYWLENAIRMNIDHGFTFQTYKGYKNKVENKLKPAFGTYRLSSFQYAPDVIQAWIDRQKADGKAKESIRGYIGCLSSAMNYAVLPLNYIKQNPCKLVKIGKVPVNKKSREVTDYICSKDDFEQILNRFPITDKYHLSLLLPYYTGTRIGETFAIDLMNDIDFEKHELDISKQVVKIGPDWHIKPPKYDSYRTLKIGSTLEDAIREVVRQRKTFRLQYGSKFLRTYVTPDNVIKQLYADQDVPDGYREMMPLCAWGNGKFISPWSFPNCCVNVIRQQLGIECFHAHSLRHTHGTILAENGVNPKTVMERLGHKDIATTLGRYTFNTETMQNTAVDIFEKAAN